MIEKTALFFWKQEQKGVPLQQNKPYNDLRNEKNKTPTGYTFPNKSDHFTRPEIRGRRHLYAAKV
jgi:hypothetical protein